MIELWIISSFVFLALVTLLCARLGHAYLYALAASFIILANISVNFSADFFGLTLSLGVVVYSMIYLITDISSEFYEKNSAYKIAISNIIIQFAFLVYALIVLQTEVIDGIEKHKAFGELFSAAPRITIASFVASLGAFFDIWVYEKLKVKTSQSKGLFSGLWFRNNVSTMLGQTLNTSLFFVIALYGVIDNLLGIIISALIVKAYIAIFDTPFLYLAGYVIKKNKGK